MKIEGENIGLIDADLINGETRHPNLALMKMSGYLKENDKNVNLLTNYKNLENHDRIFISKVFTKSMVPGSVIKRDNVTIGGTGFYFDKAENLPYEIEHHMPDYKLYEEYIKKQISNGKSKKKYKDYLDYSIGFTTRGCFRKCQFCVNRKYSKVFKHSPVKEFLDKDRKGIYLWDDNYFGYSGWEDILDEIEGTGKYFQFRQGLDIRLMDERKAYRFSKTKYKGDYIFAFDYLKDKPIIEKKLALWKKYTNKTTKLYVLCAYESQGVDDIIDTFERIKTLMKYGCLPYIMRYDSYKKSKYRGMYVQLARWCNQPQFFKKKSFREFCIANQEYHKNKKTLCASYRAMLEFEKDNPEVAKKYFDLRYDQLNEYR
jgi:hypothetical protein